MQLTFQGEHPSNPHEHETIGQRFDQQCYRRPNAPRLPQPRIADDVPSGSIVTAKDIKGSCLSWLKVFELYKINCYANSRESVCVCMAGERQQL